MSPCEKLGYKVGDKFLFSEKGVESWKRPHDMIITLIEDDDSQIPLFRFDDENDEHYVALENVYKLEDDFRVGDTVKIVRKIESNHKHGMGFGKKWGNSWVDNMDRYLDKTMTIASIADNGVCFVEDNYYSFPLASLQLVGRDNKNKDADPSDTDKTLADILTPPQNVFEVFKEFADDCADNYDVLLIVKRDSYALEFDHYEWAGDSETIIKTINLLRQLHLA